MDVIEVLAIIAVPASIAKVGNSMALANGAVDSNRVSGDRGA